MERVPPALRVRGDAWTIRGPLRVSGTLAPPGDKSVAHRAVLLAALARGPCTLIGLPEAEDVQRTLVGVEALGVRVEKRAGAWHVHGAGLQGLRPAGGPIDCGNSGTTMRLLAGILAAQPFASLLVGDASLSRRPMRRVAEPLRAMGAHIDCLGPGERPPLRIAPPRGGMLRGVEHRLGVDSAQVRSAILLAGLYAAGLTHIRPAGVARDHTERLLRALGVHVVRDPRGIALHPTVQSRGWNGFDLEVPGDPSSSAFFAAWAAAGRGGRIRVRCVALNPGRIRYLELLRDAGVRLRLRSLGERLGEPWGDFELQSGLARPLRLASEDVVRCIDEIPALLAAAAIAGVGAEILDAAELRLKESDRIASMARLLTAFGARVRVRRDGLVLEAPAALRPARVHSAGDHRIAMAAAILGARAAGASRVEGVGCVRTSYPGFAADFGRLARPAARGLRASR